MQPGTTVAFFGAGKAAGQLQGEAEGGALPAF